MLHEPLDRAFAGAISIVHPRRHFALEIEGQPVFGAAGDGVKVAAHRPEEILGPAECQVFLAGQQTDRDQFGRVAHLVDVFADPVERVQVAQRSLALLYVGFDDIAAVAHALVAFLALGQLFGDELALGPGDDIAPEPHAQPPRKGPDRPRRSALRAWRCGSSGQILTCAPYRQASGWNGRS